jgi:hypothetical protein
MEPFVPGSRRERERERHYEKQPASSAGRDDSPFISEPLGREPQRYYALSEEERYRASGRRRSRVEYEDDEHDVERERERNERRFVLDDDYRRRGSIASLGSGPGAEGYLSPPRSPRSIGSHVNGEPPRKRVKTEQEESHNRLASTSTSNASSWRRLVMDPGPPSVHLPPLSSLSPSSARRGGQKTRGVEGYGYNSHRDSPDRRRSGGGGRDRAFDLDSSSGRYVSLSV